MNASDPMARPLRGLRVDLSAGSAVLEELPADVLRLYLGGRGLGAYLLLREKAYEVAALSPDNPLIFAPGPITGGGAPAAGRYSVSARSPLTGTLFDGNSGGAFGVSLRRLGLDFLIVSGACAQPSVLVLEAAEGSAGAGDGKAGAGGVAARQARTAGVELLRPAGAGLPGLWLHRAGDLWGADVPGTLAGIRERFGRHEAAVIGPAGERGVLFAGIANNRGRQIGRGGLGAVMGAKRLKAIVIDAQYGALPGPADKERFAVVVCEASQLIKANPITSQALPEFGTSVLLNVLNQAGALPTRNFRESQFEHAEAISGEALRSGFVEKRCACNGCFIGCARLTRTADGGVSGGPQYESVWALGADCGVGDLQAVVQANHACNRAGLDTITMGSTIACAMELSELGLLEGGPRFGDAAAVRDLIAATAARRGLGDELAEGSARFAARHGRPDLSMSVKSLELPAYDPRGMTAQGLAFATSNRGACHSRANMLGPEILGVPRMIDRFATLGKAGLLIDLQNLNAVLDSLVMCKFAAFAVKEDYYAQLLSAVIGETIEPQELLTIGERIWTAERLFNLAAGFSRADDTLPRRLLEEPVAAGPSVGRVVDLPPMLAEYYLMRGWDADGVPQPRKLAELGLEWAAVRCSRSAGCDVLPIDHPRTACERSQRSLPVSQRVDRPARLRSVEPQSENAVVTAKLFAGLRDVFGGKEIEVDLSRASTVKELLAAICDTSARRSILFDEKGAITKDIVMLINGRTTVFLGGAGAALHGGDVISLFPPLSGG